MQKQLTTHKGDIILLIEVPKCASWGRTLGGIKFYWDKYGVLHDIDFGIGWGYGFIPVGTELDLPTKFFENFESYEEARLECLKQLIKIVKDGK